jgi:hypothetical protein
MRWVGLPWVAGELDQEPGGRPSPAVLAAGFGSAMAASAQVVALRVVLVRVDGQIRNTAASARATTVP